MIRYLTLGEYFWLAEQVTGIDAGVLAKGSRSDLLIRLFMHLRPPSEMRSSTRTYTRRRPCSFAGWRGITH